MLEMNMNPKRLLAILFVIAVIIALILVSCMGGALSPGGAAPTPTPYPTLAPVQIPDRTAPTEPEETAEQPTEPAEEAEPTEPTPEPTAEPTPEPSPEPTEAPTAEPTPVPSTTDQDKVETYTIKRGDTLWGIAKRFYGNGGKWHDIQAANPDVTRNPRRIYAGTELTLP